MFLVQLLTGSWIRRLAIWKIKTTPAGRPYLCLRVQLAPFIEGIGFSWLPTPMHSDHKHAPNNWEARVQTQDKESEGTSAVNTLVRPFFSGGEIEQLFTDERPLARGDNGIPKELDAIAGLGNAVVPQVVYEIFKAIDSVVT